MLNEKDLIQLSEKGITSEKLQWQISVFEKGVAFINLSRPATIGDGVIKFEKADIKKYVSIYDRADAVTKTKFVPASGAASRMFKALYEFVDEPQKDEAPAIIEKFIDNIEKFAFYIDLKDVLEQKGKHLQQLKEEGDFLTIIRALLLEDGLSYGSLPKGLLKFHANLSEVRTPFEEHLFEAAKYASSPGQAVNLHFTVSPEHMKGFKDLMNRVVSQFEEKYGIKYSITFSIQKPSTDTLAVDMNNQPFRNNDGSMLFRPGGHGALLDNLNELKSEILFVKNIDNVVPEKYVEPTINYKKALAGKLLELREQVCKLLEELENNTLTVERAKMIYKLIAQELCYQPKSTPVFDDLGNVRKSLFEILNRPIRVCGVVKNLGEPGGGPFWAPNSKGDISLQIIESSQVDQDNPRQMEIFNSATHFNPVDLVCCPYDYKRRKFDLHAFVDESTCFISHKSKDGKDLKALELPGLWNGAMADWLTVFVEVPVETFNPVKTVNDLLRPQHQLNIF
jgi:hypothetical protein